MSYINQLSLFLIKRKIIFLLSITALCSIFYEYGNLYTCIQSSNILLYLLNYKKTEKKGINLYNILFQLNVIFSKLYLFKTLFLVYKVYYTSILQGHINICPAVKYKVMLHNLTLNGMIQQLENCLSAKKYTQFFHIIKLKI